MANDDSTADALPTVLLVIGMAGSGKSTFMKRLNSHLRQNKFSNYIINLDPAVLDGSISANIDIKDTVNYKETMSTYNLGPNGAILTCLNLFTTKFDEVLDILEERAPAIDFVSIDTPGQIEIFTWSASGALITDALALAYPTIVVYVVDTVRCESPLTFMSNMLYACSILYKTKLPFVIVFNKIDVLPCEFALEWMRDFEAFQEAVAKDSSYSASLVHSMNLLLEEFYAHLKCVGVSSYTGEGFEEFMQAVTEATTQYNNEYRPEVEAKIAEQRAQNASSNKQTKESDLQRLLTDLSIKA